MRDRPYAEFNFLVDLGDGSTEGPEAGFAEVTGLAVNIDRIEYRNGNERENAPRVLTGLARVSEVTLRRGVIGSLSLWRWLDEVQAGDQNAARNVTISLQSEDHTAVVQAWRLLRARPVRYLLPSLRASGRDVAIEELVLASERLEVE